MHGGVEMIDVDMSVAVLGFYRVRLMIYIIKITTSQPMPHSSTWFNTSSPFGRLWRMMRNGEAMVIISRLEMAVHVDIISTQGCVAVGALHGRCRPTQVDDIITLGGDGRSYNIQYNARGSYIVLHDPIV